MNQPSSSHSHDLLHRAQLVRLDERVTTAWQEYLAMTRAGAPEAYAQTETFAWRRLRRSLAELASERRRVDFEHDRVVADARGISRAA